MTKLPWEFTRYPEVWETEGSTFRWSDEVLVKQINGEVHLAHYCQETEEWLLDDGQRIPYTEVACWTYYGIVPETVTPMPRRRV